MEHNNPLLRNQQSPQKFITVGEIMLRLTPPNYEKIRMANNFDASYGGSEAKWAQINIGEQNEGLSAATIHFAEVGVELTGITVMNKLRSIRIQQAKAFLSEGHSALYVCQVCGFESPSYFGKIFKSVTGMTPGEYRQRNLIRSAEG